MSLFVIDDHPLVRQAIGMLLRRLRPTSVVVELEKFSELPAAIIKHGTPELFVLDLLLPGVKGTSAVHDTKAMYPEVPLVVLSAMPAGEAEETCIEAGADLYIEKSTGANEISAAIQGLFVADATTDAEWAARAPRCTPVDLQRMVRAQRTPTADESRRRFEARNLRQIAARFRVACAGQHAARLRHQGENMPRLDDIRRLGAGRHGGLNGARPIGRRNAGGHALGGFNGHREVGAMRVARVLHHERQIQLLAARFAERQADQTAPVTGHEVHVLGGAMTRRQKKVAFVLAVLVIHDDNHASGANIFDDFLD
jgi:DNA-binding NarL/FixJ family response regulator